jgi:uracil phosphoribosyltransferase
MEGNGKGRTGPSLDIPAHDEIGIPHWTRGVEQVVSPRIFPLRPQTAVAYTTVDLSSIRPGCSVTAIDTPEAKSLLACFELAGEDLVLTPGRLHLGARRRLDAAAAAFQMMSVKPFAETIRPYAADGAVIVSVLREGPILRIQENLHLAAGVETRDHILISVHHVPDAEGGHMGLRAEADYYRCELSKQEASTIRQLIIGDSVAGGRNIIETLNIIRRDLPNLQSLVVISVHASLKGIERIVKHAPEEINEVRFFCPNGAMTASVTNHYDCYLPRHRPDTLPDPRDLSLFDLLYGEASPWVPIGGDWSANFLNPTRASEVYETQLGSLGLTIEGIRTRTRDLTLEDVVSLGFDPQDLMPYSTLMGLKG